MTLLNKRVRKTGGSFQHTGTVVAEFNTTAGEPRIALEFDAPVQGMLHIYRPDQVEVIRHKNTSGAALCVPLESVKTS